MNSIEVQKRENGFEVTIGYNDGENFAYKSYVYIKPNHVTKAFKEFIKAYMPERKPREKKQVVVPEARELKVGV